MGTLPIQPDEEMLRRNLALTLGTQAPLIPHQGPEVATPGPIQMPGNGTPDLSIPNPSPKVNAPRGTVQGDQTERARMLNSGSGISQIQKRIEGTQFGQNHPLAAKVLGGVGQGLATLGDVGLSAVAPSLAINLPGTEYHHMAQIHGLNKQIGAEENEQHEQAQTQDLNAQPEIKQAQMDLNQQKVAETARQHDEQLREHGFKTDELGKIVPLPYAEMNPQQQAVYDLKGSQEELAEATTALKKEQADPDSPQARMAAQRIETARNNMAIASRRLGLSEDVFNARYHGTDSAGNPLPGAMITDEGQPVGSSFSVNVRPTGTERNKGDMARSADQQIDDMAAIVSKRPDIFGPAAGRKTDFTVWLGSQDPDAQRFRAARTIAGDHLAGTFGGRSEAALAALDSAIGHFKDNPAAVTAGLNQLKEANHLFLKAGSVRTEGSNANAQAQPTFKVKLSDAMALPQNKGKSEADVEADVKKHGGEVVK